MTSIQGSARKASLHRSESTGNAASIAQIVGLVCVLGFIVDMLILAFPLSLGNVQWRIAVLQQMGDRSIVLLLGAALLLFANYGRRQVRKPLSLLAISVGAFFFLSSIVALRDGTSFNKLTTAQIGEQATALQQQIDQAKTDSSLAPELTPQQLQQVEQELKRRTDTLQQQAKIGALKRSSSSVGNLLITGGGLILIGRAGSRSRLMS